MEVNAIISLARTEEIALSAKKHGYAVSSICQISHEAAYGLIVVVSVGPEVEDMQIQHRLSCPTVC